MISFIPIGSTVTGSVFQVPAAGDSYSTVTFPFLIQNYQTEPNLVELDPSDGATLIGSSSDPGSGTGQWTWTASVAPNYGPGDVVWTGSLTVEDETIPETISGPWYYKVQSLNGGKVIEANGTSSAEGVDNMVIDSEEDRVTVQVSYWGIDSYSQIQDPVIGGTRWRVYSEGVVSSSSDTFVVAYVLTGSNNEGSDYFTTIDFPVSSSTRHYVSSTTLAVTQSGYVPAEVLIELVNATGSTYYIPASGSSPTFTFPFRVSGWENEPTCSIELDGGAYTLGITSSSLGENDMQYNYNCAIAANFGPENYTWTASFTASDATIPDIDSIEWYYEIQALNGGRVIEANGTSSAEGVPGATIDKDGTSFTCDVYYWGVDDYNEILTPVVSADGYWSYSSKGMVSSSGDTYVYRYTFTGTENTGTSIRYSSINFPVSSSTRNYISSTTLAVTQSANPAESLTILPYEATGSTFFVPAKGEDPSGRFSFRIYGWEQSPSYSIDTGDAATVTTVTTTALGAGDAIWNFYVDTDVNYGPTSSFWTGSITASDSSTQEQDTLEWYYELQPLNGGRVRQVDNTELSEGVSKYVVSQSATSVDIYVRYWGIDDYTEIQDPTIIGDNWTYVSKGVNYSSGSDFEYRYIFTGSANTGSVDYTIFHFPVSSSTRNYTSDTVLALAQPGLEEGQLLVRPYNATGSNFFVPASGSTPTTSFQFLFAGFEDAPTYSIDLDEGASVNTVTTTSLAQGIAVWDFNSLVVPVSGPDNDIWTGSLTMSDPSIPESKTLDWYYEVQALNGGKVINAAGTSSSEGVESVKLNKTTNTLICTLSYWGVDDYSDIQTPGITGSTRWTLGSKTLLSSSEDAYTVSYVYYGTANTGSTEHVTFNFPVSSSTRHYISSTSLHVTHSGASGSIALNILNATGSQYYVPANGDNTRFYPTFTATGWTEPPISSLNHGGTATITAFSTSVDTGSNKVTYYYTLKPTITSSLSDTRYCSFGVLDPVTTESASINWSYRLGYPSGQEVTKINGTSYSGSSPSLTISSTTTTFNCQVRYWGVGSYSDIQDPEVSGSDWSCASKAIVSSSSDTYTINYVFTGSQNLSSDTCEITADFILSSSATNINTSTTLTAYQRGVASEGGLWPIWKDTHLEENASQVVVTITQGSEDILDETLYAAPGESTISVNVNRYVESMVESPTLDNATSGSTSFSQSYVPTSFTYSSSVGDYITFQFYDNWSYDDDFVPYGNYEFSLPITSKYAIGQYLIHTYYNSTTSPMSNLARIVKDGTNMINVTIPAKQFLTVGYLVDECATWGAGRNSWTENVDADYAIYYLNPYGGWDSFPLEGKCVPSYTYERYSVINPRRFKYDYKVGKEQRYSLYTGLLEDSESLLMDYLTSSPRLYLHDLADNVVVPVRMENSEIQKKTFRNQDRIFPSYQFQVVECQQKIRR